MIGECDAERIKDEEKKSEIAKENEIAAKKQDEEIMGNNTPKTLAKFIEGKCTALVNMYTSGNINYYGSYLSLNERQISYFKARMPAITRSVVYPKNFHYLHEEFYSDCLATPETIVPNYYFLLNKAKIIK